MCQCVFIRIERFVVILLLFHFWNRSWCICDGIFRSQSNCSPDIVWHLFNFFFVRFSVPIRTKRTEQNRMYHIFFLISIVAMYKFTCPAAVFELFIMVSAAIAWSFIQYMKLLAKICTILFLLYFILFPFVLNYWLPFLYYREITKKWLNWMWNFHMWQRIPHTAHTHTSAAI